MPLTKEQEGFIEVSLDHLLDFSTDEKILKKEIRTLKKAILKPTDSSNPFYQLAQCLHDPTSHLQQLEKQQKDPVRVSEVKESIMALITDRLQLPAKEANIKLSKYWKDKKIIRTIVTEKDNCQFESMSVPLDIAIEPWVLPELDGKIYTRSIHFEAKKENFYIEQIPFARTVDVPFVVVLVYCGSSLIKKSFQLSEVPFALNDETQDLYYEKIKKEAQEKAEKFAAETAIDMLYNDLRLEFAELSITPNEFLLQKTKKEIILSPPKRQVITHQYYFENLKKKIFSLADFIDVNEHASENLLDPSIISLMDHDLCDLEKVKKLTPHEKIILTHPVFSALLKSNTLSIDKIIGINSKRSRLLLQPPVIKLIQEGTLSFSRAKKIPVYLKPLFTGTEYQTFLLENKINWRAFSKIKKYQCDLLFYFDKDLKKYVFNKPIADLVKNHRLAFKKIASLSEQTVHKLKNYPSLVHWLEKKIISLHDFSEEEDNLLYLHALIRVKRLQALCHSHPYVIDGKEDTIKIINDELSKIATQFTVDFTELQNWMIFKFFELFSLDLKEKMACASSHLMFHYQTLLNFTEKASSSSELNQRELLPSFISEVEMVYYKLKIQEFMDRPKQKKRLFSETTDTLFKKQNAEDDPYHEIKKLRRGLSQLSEMITQSVKMVASK